MRLPIDTNSLAFICAGDAQPVVDYDTRRPKTDDNGVPLYQVALVAMTDGTAEVLNVKVPGQPTGLAAGAPVRLVEMVAIPWAMGERSGVAYRAARIEPANPIAAGSGREKGASAA
jgi:hypothetical protein